MQVFKPTGYNSLSPYLISSDAQQMIKLLADVFGATVARRFDLPDGKLMHAELRIDDSILMLSDSTEKYAPNQTILHLYVANAVSVFEKAIAAGCKELDPVTQREGDPDKRGTFTDFDGNMWSVSTQQ
ncbi:MAG: VOC family protein [Chitinophagaceae bacterium]|nr:MAG: VOC family protein [Chitinophagaceae bacterium]